MVGEHTGLGNVVIEAYEKGAKSIRITSKKEEDLNIAGWTLTNESEGKVYSYKFPKNTKLKQGETCTIWSADSDEVRMNFEFLFANYTTFSCFYRNTIHHSIWCSRREAG